MSQPQPPEPAKLVIGLFMKEQHYFLPAVKDITAEFGPIDTVSNWFPFDYTDYYGPELGGPLLRRMIAFQDLIRQADLAGIKMFTNAVERQYSHDGKRRVNIDPGYMLRERFVLATGKNFSHRIYIGKGIYADLTLIYRKGAFKSLEWTYPDYADNRLHQYLIRVRKKYVRDLTC